MLLVDFLNDSAGQGVQSRELRRRSVIARINGAGNLAAADVGLRIVIPESYGGVVQPISGGFQRRGQTARGPELHQRLVSDVHIDRAVRLLASIDLNEAG